MGAGAADGDLRANIAINEDASIRGSSNASEVSCRAATGDGRSAVAILPVKDALADSPRKLVPPFRRSGLGARVYRSQA